MRPIKVPWFVKMFAGLFLLVWIWGQLLPVIPARYLSPALGVMGWAWVVRVLARRGHEV